MIGRIASRTEQRSIVLDRVRKTYTSVAGTNQLFEGLSCAIPFGHNLGILGGRGSGKSALMRLLAGIEYPTSGRIQRCGTVSWPVGRNAGFQTFLSAEDNIRFVAELYGLNFRETRNFVAELSGLERYFKTDISLYSAGMRSRLLFSLSLSVPFDFYLIDEGVRVGEPDFQRRVNRVLVERNQTATMVVVTGSEQMIRQFCRRMAVLAHGRLEVFDDIENGLQRFRQLEREGIVQR